ncbi:TPA: hypothetical protein ACRRXV_002475 [Morganella morganii]
MVKDIWSENKIPRMKFCSVKRAAELLSCNSEDIFYFAESGDVQLCAKVFDVHSHILLNYFNANKDITKWDVFEFFCGLALAENQALYLRDNKLFSTSDILSIYPNFSFTTNDTDTLINEIYGICAKNFLPVAIDGVWALDSKLFNNFNGMTTIGNENDTDYGYVFKLFDFISEDNEDDTFLTNGIKNANEYREILVNTSFVLTVPNLSRDRSPYSIHVPVLEKPILLNERNVYITAEQLNLIYQSVVNGTVISKDFDLINDCLDESNERVTARQTEVIVSAFKEIGITEDDMKGSVTSLRKKIARKAPSIALPLDDKTIIDWLRKGGISR